MNQIVTDWRDAAPLSKADFEAAIRAVGAERYHDKHEFHKLLHGGKLEKSRLEGCVEDFYLTNPIARASAVMAECSRLASGKMLTAAE